MIDRPCITDAHEDTENKTCYSHGDVGSNSDWMLLLYVNNKLAFPPKAFRSALYVFIFSFLNKQKFIMGFLKEQKVLLIAKSSLTPIIYICKEFVLLTDVNLYLGHFC